MLIFWRVLDLIHAILVLIATPLRFTKWGRGRAEFEALRDEEIPGAEWCFEVSSEGEFEQVKPWLEILMARDVKVEIVFSSPSVLKAVNQFKDRFPSQVRRYPLPLMTHTPWQLVRDLKAPRLILCRYDFFPSLMSRATVSDVTAGVVWASFVGKREKLKRTSGRYLFRYLYSIFRWVIPATQLDEVLFKRLGNVDVLPSLEMRVPQIHQRVARAPETLLQKFPHWNQFLAQLEKFPKEKRLILGSFWPVDLAMFKDSELVSDIKQQKRMVTMVPHQLSLEAVEILSKVGLEVQVIDANWQGKVEPSKVYLINLKGVLCELYSVCGLAYVGGGFGRSIHSVMEPYVAGAHVICGPRTHRSTEAENILSISSQHLVILPDEVALESFTKYLPLDTESVSKRDEWIDNQIRRLGKSLDAVEKLC